MPNIPESYCWDVLKTSGFFLALKNLSPGQFWGIPARVDIIEF